MSIHFSHIVGSVKTPPKHFPISHPKSWGKRIRERRGEMLQEELAAKVGISQGTLSLLETGQTKNPKVETILGIAAALSVSPYILMYDSAPPEAMQHTVAALVDVWDRLTERQRLQVISYAQGLLDSGPRRPDPPPPVQPKPKAGGSHSH